MDLYSKDSGYILINKHCVYKGKIPKKHEIKNIKVSKEDYEKAIEILKREGDRNNLKVEYNHTR